MKGMKNTTQLLPPLLCPALPCPTQPKQQLRQRWKLSLDVETKMARRKFKPALPFSFLSCRAPSSSTSSRSEQGQLSSKKLKVLPEVGAAESGHDPLC